MIERAEEPWRTTLTARGLQPGEVVGEGIEGVVVSLTRASAGDLPGGLPDELVAKVWHRHRPDDLAPRQRFDRAVASIGLPFATPQIVELLDADGLAVTIETRLHGRALRGADDEGRLDEAVVGPLVDVLGALAGAPAPVGADVLPALPGQPPLRGDFGPALGALVRARAADDAALRTALGTAGPDLEAWLDAVVRGLHALAPVEPHLLHGDLIAPNVLVGGDGGVVSVLDFGFLTAVGDPAFDAAVTASIVDMYGPRARDHERLLDAAIAERLPYPPERLALYRAAYALMTATVFSSTGADGHFAWCVAMLGRDDVRAAVL